MGNSTSAPKETNILIEQNADEDDSKTIKLGDYSYLGAARPKVSYDNSQVSVANYVKVSQTLSDAAHTQPTLSGIPGAVFNFTNSIVGAGIIGLPYAIKRSGFYFGTLLLCVVAVFTDYGIRHLVASAVRRHKQDYELISEWSLGKLGYYLITIFMFVQAYGGMVAYHVVVGDTVPKVLDNYFDISSPWDSRWFLVVMFSVFFMLPLSLYKQFASLSITSFLSLASVCFIIFAVIAEGPSESKHEDIDTDANLSVIRSSWFAGAGTMGFAFVCQHSTFIVYNSLRDPTLARWRIVSNVSVGLSWIMCIVLALVGYLYFRDNVESDILNSFSTDDDVINVARILLAMTMVFTFPMEQFVARHCILQLLEAWAVIKTNKSVSAHYVVTLVLWGTACLIGAMVDDVGFVLELDGAFAASVLAYIMPGIIALKANPERMERKCSCDFIMPVVLIVFGAVIMVVGTVSAFLG